jgi:hypothetical protein
VWLYRIWPQVLDAMVLVKPATVIDWHRKGFRLYWRRRSRHLGRPRMNREIRDLIRQMSRANPLWGAPRIHGELVKLGFDVSQATVGRYLPWRPKVPSPTWRSFLHNHMHNTAAIDMFVVVTATFRLLYALVVLGHQRRKVIHFDVTQNPTQGWLARQITEAFPWDTAPRFLLRDRDASYGQTFRDRVQAMTIEQVVIAPRSVGPKNWNDRRAITPPLDDNSAEARPVVRGISQAPRVGDPPPEKTAGRYPCPGDSARHGNGRRSCSAPAATPASRTGSPWTGTPL